MLEQDAAELGNGDFGGFDVWVKVPVLSSRVGHCAWRGGCGLRVQAAVCSTRVAHREAEMQGQQRPGRRPRGVDWREKGCKLVAGGSRARPCKTESLCYDVSSRGNRPR